MMTILCVDDDPATTELIALLLKPYGFQVLTTTQPQEVVPLILKHPLQAIVLDLMMPEMDGCQVCQAVRQVSNIPILILSALNDPQTIAAALDSGADDYLTKPVAGNILAAHLSRLIKRQESSSINNRDVLPSKLLLKPSISSAPTEGS